MADREQWHLSEEAVYDFVDRRLSPVARIEAERHLRSCPECARQLRCAELLFVRLETADRPRLDRDLAPGVVANLQAARTSSRRLRWVLAAQAIGAAVTLVALGVSLERWVNALLIDPAYVTLRQYGLRLFAEASAWLAPFLEFIPSFPARLAPMRVALPHLDGSVQAWMGLAVAALALGLLGNALLLRSSNGPVEKAAGGANDKVAHAGRISHGSRGGRR
jgi:anti-sigma factor RsiW